MGDLKMVILDTCALLWWTLDPDKLSEKANKTCAGIMQQGAFISSISIWEIGIKMKKGILKIGEDLNSYINRVKLLGCIEIIPIDEKIWVKNLSLKWKHKDPVDRTIVATAIIKNLPIMTKDKIIRKFYNNVVW